MSSSEIRPPEIRPLVLALLGLVLWSVPVSAQQAGASLDPFTLLPEMEASEQVVVFRPVERRALAEEAGVEAALAAFEDHVRRLWPRLREVDVVALSRFHVEETRGYALPAEPGSLETRVLGRDASGALHVDVRGPRLPARYDIVHRHLHVHGVVSPAGEIDRLVVTVRLRVYE